MLVGYRLPLFDYTDKTMKSVLDTKKMIEDEIKRVKKLGDSDKKWYCDPRPDGVYFEEDTTDKLQGVAAAKMNCLADMGIVTIKDAL